jgi:methylenetetrahydrofolate reductase (NADPH)
VSNNIIRDSLASGRFTYMVELVASAKTTEEKLAEIGASLAKIPGVIAGSVTSFAGGSAGHDPVVIAKIIQPQGLTPNVHLTCVSNPREKALAQLEEMHAAGIYNVFCITGDHPQAGKLKKEDLAPLSGYDMDSVQLIEMVAELRKAANRPYFISCAVSPFKYTEPDCVYQYLKLEKKIAAGADFAITQLGYDSKKFRELKRYLAENGLAKFPVFGNVYILSAGAAKKFAKGEPPGCWASETLRDTVVAESEASSDKGLQARLERAAKMVAIVRGLGYAGAYLGGDHDAEHLRWVIERSEEIADRWEEFAEEIAYGPKGGFYLYETPKAPPKPRGAKVAMFEVLDKIGLAHQDGIRRSIGKAVMSWIDASPRRAEAFEKLELKFKQDAFGCQNCGNCVLGEMEYVCPMTCPKNLRNGPCGGPFNGMCEVTPEQPCIWVSVYERAKAMGRIEHLKTFIPARNPALSNTSSYINFYLGRDSRPENFKGLIQIENGKAKLA